MGEDRIRIVKSICRICYNSCGVQIHLKDNVPFKVEGDPENPMNKGVLCPKGYASLEYMNHPDRLRYPLKRVGPKGKGRWDRISWDEALENVAQGLNKVKERYGVLATVFIRGASKGLSDDMLARFANVFGSPNITSPAPYCFVPGSRAAGLSYGYYQYPDFDFGPRTILLWGVNPPATNPCDHEEIKRARANNAKLIVIDPLESELTRSADHWIRLRPGTDVALCLGIMNIMINENLFDEEFVRDWTVGFDKLKKHVQRYSLEEVEKITWVPAALIRKVAKLYAVQKPGVIIWGNGIETNINSFQTCRAIAMLRAIAGNLGVPGGEVHHNTPGGILRGDPDFLCQGNIPRDIRDQRLSKSDGILPVNYYTLPQKIVRAILAHDPYPVHAAYVQAANILTHWPNADKSVKALEKLGFLVVADQFMTPTAAMADVVLPAATYLEFDSIEQPWNYPIASAQQKVAQVGEARSDCMILNELLRKLGYLDYVFEGPEELMNRVVKPAGITFEEFRKIGYFLGPKLYRHYEKSGFKTDSNKVELYSEKLDAWGFDPLPVFREIPGIADSGPGPAEEFPLVLITRKSNVYRHSGGRQIPSLRDKHPDPVLKIHSETGARLTIKEGDRVYIATKKGKIEQRAAFCDTLDPRVVEVDYAWWFPEEKGDSSWRRSNVNILTDDALPCNREMGSPNLRGILCKVWRKDT